MTELLVQQLINGIVIGSTYAVVAIGFALVFSVLRVINFAHPDIFMLGMFGGLAAGTYISHNFFVVLVGGALCAGVAGLVLERTVLRPLMGRDVLMTLIGTLGIAIVCENGVASRVGPDPIPFPSPFPKVPIISGDITLSVPQVVNFVISLLLLIGVSFYVRCTKFGRATRAIAERPDVAAAFGVDVNRVSQITVALASTMAGVAGVSVGILYGNAWAFVGLLFGLKAFVCMLVAGNRYFEGVILVAFVLGITEALVTGYLSSTLRDAVAFVLMIGVLYVRPSGLFGSYS
jgi:branched-chain amino acid transport system permease protein